MTSPSRFAIRRLLPGLLLATLMVLPPAAAAAEAPPPQNPGVDLEDRLADIEVHRVAAVEADNATPSGPRWIVVEHVAGERIELTPDQFLQRLHEAQAKRRGRLWPLVVLNISDWFGVLWVTLGLMGQIVFTGRMVVQWLVSEREHRSVVPVSFWWMSLVGASMLITYFIWRKDIVGVLGQAAGWFIYVRNLWMIYHPDRRPHEG